MGAVREQRHRRPQRRLAVEVGVVVGHRARIQGLAVLEGKGVLLHPLHGAERALHRRHHWGEALRMHLRLSRTKKAKEKRKVAHKHK